jgi:PBP1b-binding outer membrane lipoprotein LpoB
MRKSLIIFVIISAIFLSGCSLLEGVNHSLEYVNKATEHINTWNDFGQEAPQLIQEAMTNPEAKVELENKISTLLEEIELFNQTKPPAIAEEIHQKIVEKNEALKGVMESAMVNGELVVEQLESSELFALINEVTRLMNLLENLGL